MKLLSSALLATCVGLSTAHPTSKTCVTQAGSASDGVPIFGTDFTAMNADWSQMSSAPANIFSTDAGDVTVDLDGSADGGAFVIASAGTVVVSNYDSACVDGCSRLACISGPISDAVQFSIDATDVTGCDDIDLVVGYANSNSDGNTLQFAKVNACDPADIVVTGVNAGNGAAGWTLGLAAAGAAALAMLA